MAKLLASVELGGTKAIAAVASNPLAPLLRTRIPTTDPDSTLGAIAAFFASAAEQLGKPSAVGIGAFGLVDIDRHSLNWGRIGISVKPGWEGANPAQYLQERLGGCPTALDTDVNAAALAEARWGVGKGLGDFAYLTVGTGIGGGLIAAGQPVHGARHPEIGHVAIRQNPDDDFPGQCPFHGNCAEGLASGPSIVARFGTTLDQLAPDHPFHAILADYLGQLCAILVMVASPQRIIVGGGVMVAAALHPAIEQAMRNRLAGYPDVAAPNGDGFVVAPGLGDHAGLAGGFALAQDLLSGSAERNRVISGPGADVLVT